MVLQTIGDSLTGAGGRSAAEAAQRLAAGLLLVSGESQAGQILFGFVTGRAPMQTATKKSGAGSRA